MEPTTKCCTKCKNALKDKETQIWYCDVMRNTPYEGFHAIKITNTYQNAKNCYSYEEEQNNNNNNQQLKLF